MDKKLYEAFTIKYGFTPEAVLSLTDEQIDQLSEDQCNKAISALIELYDETHKLNVINVVDGEMVIKKSEDNWK